MELDNIVKKPTLTLTTKDLITGMQNDFLEATEKQTMVPISEVSGHMLTGKDKYWNNLVKCMNRGKKALNGDFFIEVIRQLEVFQRKTVKTKYLYTPLMSTPRPGSAYYKYTRKDDRLDFLWDLPVIRACEIVYHNRVALALENKELVDTVTDYYSGKLFYRQELLNEEQRRNNKN